MIYPIKSKIFKRCAHCGAAFVVRAVPVEGTVVRLKFYDRRVKCCPYCGWGEFDEVKVTKDDFLKMDTIRVMKKAQKKLKKMKKL